MEMNFSPDFAAATKKCTLVEMGSGDSTRAQGLAADGISSLKPF
jgi:uncharacterized SAM-dependent methyltransferase